LPVFRSTKFQLDLQKGTVNFAQSASFLANFRLDMKNAGRLPGKNWI